MQNGYVWTVSNRRDIKCFHTILTFKTLPKNKKINKKLFGSFSTLAFQALIPVIRVFEQFYHGAVDLTNIFNRQLEIFRFISLTKSQYSCVNNSESSISISTDMV